MNPGATLESARRGRLYPSVILHGGDAEARRRLGVALARALLCAAPPGERPCGTCRHCRRIAWPEEGGESPFHPDFHLLERDLKTATSVEATRELLRGAQLTPFEARGQVFLVASAETLSPEASNALLKLLEEPPVSAPRNFLLLAPSRLDLLPTLRSRSLSVYLGPAEPVDAGLAERLAGTFAAAVGEYGRTGSSVFLLAAAEALAKAGGWDDVRSGAPWAAAAAAVVRAAGAETVPAPARRGLFALAEDLLAAPALRQRGVTAERILEGLMARHLAQSPC